MGKNCWEVKECGRQGGGAKVKELGQCPASGPGPFDGRNGGKFAGRYCWQVAGTLCGGKVQGSYATKLLNCATCDVYQTVRKEEGAAFAI